MTILELLAVTEVDERLELVMLELNVLILLLDVVLLVAVPGLVLLFPPPPPQAERASVMPMAKNMFRKFEYFINAPHFYGY